MRRPVSLRARLTAVFAAASAVMLAAAALVIFFLFSAGVTASIDSGLAQRQRSIERLAAEDRALGQLRADSGEPLLQIYGPTGSLRTSTLALGRTALLTADQVRRARRGPVSAEREQVAEEGEGARVRAFPLRSGRYVVALGESLDRYEDLRLRLAVLLAATMAGALLLASYVGFRVAGAALGPVERMRRRASQITDSDLHERLPVPRSGDEIARLGLTFNELLDRLSGAVERERRLVSDASHELRTPLAVLRAELEVANRDDRTREQLSAAVHSALDETRRLSRLAEDLLILARSDQGRLPLRLETLEVLDVLDQARGRHGAAVQRAGRGLRATTDIPGGAALRADPDRLAQLLDNLVANALRHGAGAIDLRAALADDGRVAITVSDEGPGFGATLPQAFERFTQGDPAHGGPGSGLGLAIVEAIARAHGGEVRAEDLPAGGARVTVLLPAA